MKLNNGGTRTATRFDYRNDAFFGAPETEPGIARDSVAVWRVNQEATDATLTSADNSVAGPPAAPPSPERLDEYYAKAQEIAVDHPGAIGVHLIDHGTFTLTADGKHLYRYHFVGLILNQKALDWSQISLGYREGRNQARIIAAHGYSPESGVSKLDPAQIEISSPAQDGQFFSTDLKSINATIPGAEPGSLIEFVIDYETPKPEVPELFSPSFRFQSDVPVASSRFDVIVPENTRLLHWCENWPKSETQSPKITEIEIAGQTYKRHRWLLENLQPTTEEPQMPPESEIVPVAYTTITTSWDDFNKLVGDMQRERIIVNDEIQELAENITAKAKTKNEKTAAVYHWVQKNIRYISVKSSLSSGWSGHPSPQTLAQGYGDCTDKSILFCALLKAVGIQAHPIVLRTNDQGLFKPKHPVLACNHCITKVFLDDNPIYLDATSQDYRFPAFRADDHGAMAFDFLAGIRETIPIPKPGLCDGKHAQETVEIEKNGKIVITAQNSYSGEYEARLRAVWKSVPVAMRTRMMQQYLNSVAPGSKLLDFTFSDPTDLDTPFTMSYRFENNTLASRADDFLILQLPDRELTFPEAGLDRRQYPIAYTTAQKRTRTTIITVAPELTIVEPPPDIEIKTDGHTRYRESFTQEQEGNENHATTADLTFNSHFQRERQRIPVAQYSEYRDALRDMRQASRRVILLKIQNSLP